MNSPSVACERPILMSDVLDAFLDSLIHDQESLEPDDG